MPAGAKLALNADFSANSIGFAAPVIAGLEFWGNFGDTLQKTQRNLVVGKPAFSVVGSPAIQPNYATFTAGSHFLQSGLVDQPEVTLFSIARVNSASPAAQYKYMIGSYSGAGREQGTNLFFENGPSSRPTVGSTRVSNSTDTLVFAQLATPDSAASFAFYAARVGAAYNRIDDKTRGTGAGGPTATTRSQPGSGFYRIGTVGGSTGMTDMTWAAGYSRMLTDAEIEAIYQSKKAELAAKGIAI